MGSLRRGAGVGQAPVFHGYRALSLSGRWRRGSAEPPTRGNLPWPQVLLGDWDETPVPEQLGISSVPAYFLIDADGLRVERGFTLETVVEKLGEPKR